MHAEGFGCPKGTTPNGETTPEVRDAWCELSAAGKTVQHGPYRSWWPNGKLGADGQYERGLMVGKWTGWFPNGKMQGEEWYQSGVLTKSRYLDEKGREVRKIATPKNPSSSQLGGTGTPR